MYLFVEKSMRVGISYITKRYSKASNKYMKLYDDSKLSKCSTYMDTNNLYGWAMSQYLPYSGFKWLNQKEFGMNLIREISSHGCVLEVDLECPDKLQSVYNDCPLAPEKLETV